MKSVLVKVFVVLTVTSIIFMSLDATNSINIKLGGDWIGYWGGMVSAFISIIGIYWTFENEREKREVEERKSHYPFSRRGDRGQKKS